MAGALLRLWVAGLLGLECGDDDVAQFSGHGHRFQALVAVVVFAQKRQATVEVVTDGAAVGGLGLFQRRCGYRAQALIIMARSIRSRAHLRPIQCAIGIGQQLFCIHVDAIKHGHPQLGIKCATYRNASFQHTRPGSVRPRPPDRWKSCRAGCVRHAGA